MNLFMDRFASCTDEAVTIRDECVGDDRRWLNPYFGSFDNFPSAMLVLFVSATGDAWEDVMFAGMDARGPGVAPLRNDYSWNVTFFIAWLLFGTFVVINLFVGSVVDNFTIIQKTDGEDAMMTTEQKQWQRAYLAAKSAKPCEKAEQRAPPPMPFRLVFNLVTSPAFDHLMTAVILANMLLLTIDHHRIEDETELYEFYQAATRGFSCVPSYMLEPSPWPHAHALRHTRACPCRVHVGMLTTPSVS